MTREAKDRRGIQSVGIGMRVLAAVAELSGPASLSTIAQRAALSPSQAYRYLSSLMAAGMLKQAGRSGLYDLDAGAIRIGLAALSRIDAFSVTDEILKELVVETRRTCLVAVWGDAGPTIIRWFSGSPPVMTSVAVGSTLPMLRSATGRIFHAFGEEIEMDRQVRLLEITDPAGIPHDLAALRRRIRLERTATISGDVVPGLRAAAAPIFDLQGRLVLVATLLAGAAFPLSGDGDAEKALVEACRRITQSLGGVWESQPEPPATEPLATTDPTAPARRRTAAPGRK